MWINYDEQWKRCDFIKKIDEKIIQIKLDDNIINCSVEKLFKSNTNQEDNRENLTELINLNLPSILNSLQIRYKENNIYTYTGEILISINPFKNFNLYNDENIIAYSNKTKKKPHIYQIVNKCLDGLNQTNQSILISGESGAGKTYTTRTIMNYLAKISGDNTATKTKIINSNPILEAFGNAKTIINDNSSRFGKFIKLQFIKKNNKFILNSAVIKPYLLEKIRVITQNKNERNFHIFYQMLAGLSDEEKDKYFLKDFTDYSYLNNQYIKRNDGVNDENEFKITLNAFKLLGFSEQEIDFILRVTSAVLNLSNNTSIQKLSQLLGIDVKLINEALNYKNITVQNKKIQTELTNKEKIIARDSLAMKIYHELFIFIINKINLLLNGESDCFIGILDIFGFENFATNNFEQYCINYTNEVLQAHFNKHIFKLEQEIYKEEGINWENISYPDNKECLKLERNIYNLLDQESKLQANDKNLIRNINKKYKDNSLLFFKKISTESKFTIKHYAGLIEYTIKNFCQKNLDIISNEITLCVNTIFNKTTIKKSSRINAKTIGQQFRNQLKNLMKLISQTYSYYVRCLRPNDLNKPDYFDVQKITEQLKYSGILEAIRVARAGYPIRILHNIFLDNYKLVGTNLKQILDKSPNKSYQIGKTKVFLTHETIEDIEELKNNKIKHYVIVIQKYTRRYNTRRLYYSILNSIIKIQSIFRMYQAKKLANELRIIKIQSFFRCYNAVKKFKLILRKIRCIQKCYKKYKYKLYLNKIILIQRICKQFLYKKYNASTIINRNIKKYLLNKKNSIKYKELIKIKKLEEKNIEKDNEINKLKNIINNNILKKNNVIQKLETNLNLLKIEKMEQNLKMNKLQIEQKEQCIKMNKLELEKKNLNDDIKSYNNWVSHQIESKIKTADKIYNLEDENMRLKQQIKELTEKKSWFSIFKK